MKAFRFADAALRTVNTVTIAAFSVFQRLVILRLSLIAFVFERTGIESDLVHSAIM